MPWAYSMNGTVLTCHTQCWRAKQCSCSMLHSDSHYVQHTACTASPNSSRCVTLASTLPAVYMPNVHMYCMPLGIQYRDTVWNTVSSVRCLTPYSRRCRCWLRRLCVIGMYIPMSTYLLSNIPMDTLIAQCIQEGYCYRNSSQPSDMCQLRELR